MENYIDLFCCCCCSRILMLVLCLLTLPEEDTSPLVFSMTAFNASWIELIEYCASSCCCCSLLLLEESSSPVMNKTFLTRPPRVVISAFSVLKRNAFKVFIRSGKRSDLSSQQIEALITNLPSSSDVSTVSSSISVGTGLVSAIKEVWRFSSLTCWMTSASNEALSVYTTGKSPNKRTKSMPC